MLPFLAPRHRPWLKTAAALLLLLAGTTAPWTLQAATELRPRIDAGGLYETNPRLNRSEENDALGTRVDARLEMSYRTERTELAFEPRGVFSFYADQDDQDLENNDGYLPLDLSFTTPRSRLAASLSYSDVQLRTSELETAGGTTPGGTGNLSFITDRQQRIDIQPSWTLQMTPRDRLQLSAGYTDVEYSRTSATSRYNYDYASVSAAVDRSFTTKTYAGLSLFASQYKSEEPNSGIQNDSQTVGANVFVNYQFDETLSGYLSFGGRDTSIDITRQPAFTLPGFGDVCFDVFDNFAPCQQTTDGSNYVGEVALRKSSQRTNYDVSYSRDISPNSNGAETVRDTIRILADRQFTAKLSGDLGVLYYNQQDAAELTAREQEYVSANAGLRWRFTRQWSLRGIYRYVYVRDKFSFSGDASRSAATNHYLFLGVGWQGLGWRR